MSGRFQPSVLAALAQQARLNGSSRALHQLPRQARRLQQRQQVLDRQLRQGQSQLAAAAAEAAEAAVV